MSWTSVSLGIFDSWLDEPYTWGWSYPVPASQVVGDLAALACFHKVRTYHIIVTDPVRGLEPHMGARSSRTAVLAEVYYTRKVTLRTVPRSKSSIAEKACRLRAATQAQCHGLPAHHPQIRPNQTEPN